MGMTRDEFLDATPVYFDLLLDKRAAERSREQGMTELMTAQLIAMVANTGFARYTEQRRPEEFMPSRWKDDDAPKNLPLPKRMTKKQRAQRTAAYCADANRRMREAAELMAKGGRRQG
jgi:hypothetical protein